MLAEPRYKQKWSEDPRNTRWASDLELPQKQDKSKFGYQMLTKMGWSEGKGLGHKENGSLSHIKVNKHKTNAGIGMKKSHEDDWISHQDDFNALLSQLNQGGNGNSKSKITSLEERVKMSKKKILYTKFVKSKDLSNASSQDLACIFGQRSRSTPATPQLSDEEDFNSDNSCGSCLQTKENNVEHGVMTVNTGVSVADYFAKKMAALKQVAAAPQDSLAQTEVIALKSAADDTNLESKKKKKRKCEGHNTSDYEEETKTKKKKKKKIRFATEELIENDNINHSEIIRKTKKKKKKEKLAEEKSEDKIDDSKLKKKRKRKLQDDEKEGDIDCTPEGGNLNPCNSKIIEQNRANVLDTENFDLVDAPSGSSHCKKKKKRKKDKTVEQEKEIDLEKNVDITIVTENNSSGVRGFKKTPIKENDIEEIPMTFEKSGLVNDKANKEILSDISQDILINDREKLVSASAKSKKKKAKRSE